MLVLLPMEIWVFVSLRPSAQQREVLPQETVPQLSVSAVYVSFIFSKTNKPIKLILFFKFLVTVSACGGTVTQNNTYIQSPNYPAPAPVGMCMYTMNKCDSDICQFR